ncbi:MAG TPA: asparaginase [Planctomycetes bacterium]|nr:asparaginase [Planctomycetota bacterium]
MRITFIQTGGTIDKDYPRSSGGYAFEFGEPATERLLARLNPSFDYDVRTAFQKDSTEIDASDRQQLLQLIRDDANDKVIVTHGTDTMLETAAFLAKHVTDKLIVITGAMRPERFSDSDAPLNVGCAIATANLCECGVFVAMHGIIKPHDQMQRDPSTGKYH